MRSSLYDLESKKKIKKKIDKEYTVNDPDAEAEMQKALYESGDEEMKVNEKKVEERNSMMKDDAGFNEY